MALLSIILLIGIVTTSTDLIHKKIKNRDLLIGAALGAVALGYNTIVHHDNILFHLSNGLAAFLLGFLLFRYDLWKGGDAKLFALFALLMPQPTYFLPPLSSVISLFACSFIGGSIILLPALLRDIIINRRIIANEFFLPEKRQGLFLGIGGIFFFSWALFPLYYLSRFSNPIFFLIIMYLIFHWAYNDAKKVHQHFIADFLHKNRIAILLGIAFGLVMRLWLSPESLALPALRHYFMQILLSSIMTTVIHAVFNHVKNYNQRIPFAPLIFAGCLLSYTSFLPSAQRVINFIISLW